jgi:hypothetical protein
MSQINKTVTIPMGSARSDPVFLGTKSLVAFHFKYGWPETMAPIYFEVRTEEELTSTFEWNILMQNGAPVFLSPEKQLISIDPALTRPFSQIRVITGYPGDVPIVTNSYQAIFELIIDDVPGGGTSSLNMPIPQRRLIGAANSRSQQFTIWGYVPVTLVMPAAWTPAPITFLMQFAPVGTTSDYTNRSLYSETGEYVIPTAAAYRVIALNHCLFLGAAYVWIRSGTEASPVAQTAARTLTLVLRKVD